MQALMYMKTAYDRGDTANQGGNNNFSINGMMKIGISYGII